MTTVGPLSASMGEHPEDLGHPEASPEASR